MKRVAPATSSCVRSAALRHLDDAPRQYLFHSARVSGPDAFASRLPETIPGLIEGGGKHSDGFGVERRVRPGSIEDSGHPRTPIDTNARPRRSEVIAADVNLLIAPNQSPRNGRVPDLRPPPIDGALTPLLWTCVSASLSKRHRKRRPPSIAPLPNSGTNYLPLISFRSGGKEFSNSLDFSLYAGKEKPRL
jgi:hypothetical protein